MIKSFLNRKSSL